MFSNCVTKNVRMFCIISILIILINKTNPNSNFVHLLIQMHPYLYGLLPKLVQYVFNAYFLHLAKLTLSLLSALFLRKKMNHFPLKMHQIYYKV